jgi:very-short-patch-repair endonuclease
VDLRALATTQHGVAHVDQLARLGVTRTTVRGRVAAGLWHVPLPRIVALHPGGCGVDARRMAVVLWLPRGVLCGPTAAALHGLRTPRATTVHVAVTRGHPRGTAWVVVRRLRELPDDHVVHVGGLPVTSPARTVVDLHEMIRGRAARRAFAIDAVQRRITSAADIVYAATTTPGLDHRNEIAQTMLYVLAGAESLAEAGFADFCARWRLPSPRAQYAVATRVGTVRLDFAFVEERVAVEVDGYDGHAFDRQRRRDHERDLALAALGWLVVRVEPRRLAEAPRLLHDDLSHLLAARRTGLPA